MVQANKKDYTLKLVFFLSDYLFNSYERDRISWGLG